MADSKPLWLCGLADPPGGITTLLWPQERFRTRGIIYEPTDKSASAMFIEVLPLINARAIALLDNRRLLDQLIALERRTSFGTGRDTVGHPPGSHDDLAVAVAGAVMLAGARRPKSWTGTYRCGYAPGPWMNRLGGGAMVRKPAREPLRLRTVRIAEKDMAKYGIKTLP